jgi:hypothetical protein
MSPDRRPPDEADAPDPSSRAPAQGEDLGSVEDEQIGGDASAATQLGVAPATEISASQPRGPDEIQLDEGLDPDRAPDVEHTSPLTGDTAPANDIAGVPESQVTDRQGATPKPGDPRGGVEHPPASTAGP